jgi:hypothetical protein
MTRKIDLPPEQHVRTVMAAMLADAAGGGPRPTVLALARSLGWIRESLMLFAAAPSVSRPEQETDS